MTGCTLGRRRFVGLALPLARRGLRAPRPTRCYYTIAVKPGPDLPGGPAGRAAARHRPGELSRPPRDRALVGRLQARRACRTTGGASRWAACWGACWWSACRSACPAARSTARAAPSPRDPNAIVGVNIQRLDADKAGTLQLLAQAAVEFNRPRRSAARTFTHRQAACRPRPSRARWRRSATPWASSPTASRRCCSAESSFGRGPRPAA